MALLDATTAARVKTVLGITDSNEDTYLGVLITSVSQSIEEYLDRPIKNETQTEELDVDDREHHRFFLRAAPVSSITSVKNNTLWDWANATALTSTFYHVNSTTGELFLHASPAPGMKALQVVYVGGFATTTANLIPSLDRK